MYTGNYVIMLNGSYGVGKSATLDHVGDLLAEAGQPFSLMDVDWFHRSWPPAVDDPENVLTEAENMAAVWANYAKAGPRQLVVSGVIRDARDRERYERALRLQVRSVRLETGVGTTATRLRRRYSDDQVRRLEWHLDRHQELASRLVAADLDELAISTDDRSPRVVAEEVLRHFGLTNRPLWTGQESK